VNHIAFQAVQLLNFTEADQPCVTVDQGIWTLVANRNGEQIMITAPDMRQRMSPIQPVLVKRQGRKQPRSFNQILKGEEHPKAKLTAQDVTEMRELFKDKSYRSEFGSEHKVLMEFAKIYNIHYTTAYKIVRGQSWKHLTDA